MQSSLESSAVGQKKNFLIIALVFFSQLLLAHEEPIVIRVDPYLARIRYKKITITPSDAIARQWLDDAITTEYWDMTGAKGHLLRDFALEPDDIGVNLSPPDQYENYRIDPELKKKISQVTLNAIYEGLIESMVGIPYVIFDNTWDAFQVAPALVRKLLFIDGLYFLPLTPELSPLLSERGKTLLVKRLQAQNEQDAFDVTLIILPDDKLEEVAKYFSSHYEESLRCLKAERSKSPNQPFQIPLKEILHPFIKEKLNQFERCSGANCFFSTLRSTSDLSIPPSRVSSATFQRLRDQHYRASPSTPFPYQALTFTNAFAEVIHASTTIIGTYSYYLTFTKDGQSRRNPYRFALVDRRKPFYGISAVTLLLHQNCRDLHHAIAE